MGSRDVRRVDSQKNLKNGRVIKYLLNLSNDLKKIPDIIFLWLKKIIGEKNWG